MFIDDLPRRRTASVTALLGRAGAAGIQEEPAGGAPFAVQQPWDTGPKPKPPARVRLQAWFDAPDEAALARQVREAAPGAAVWFEAVVERDWEEEWRRGFAPLVISDRLVVAPPWDAPPGAVVIEPGQGFGTGQHETTRQALAALDSLVEPHVRSALDVGAGSGILALAAAHLGLEVYGIDNDPVAVVDARGNAERNKVAARFDTTPLAEVPGSYDIVLANLFAETLIELAPALIARTGSALVLAGILADREAGVRHVFDAQMGAPDRRVDGEWVCLTYRRPALG